MNNKFTFNSNRNVPRGLGVSFAVLIITTVSANFAYYTVLSKEESLRSDAVAMVN